MSVERREGGRGTERAPVPVLSLPLGPASPAPLYQDPGARPDPSLCFRLHFSKCRLGSPPGLPNATVTA